jgi:hypothetical protein
MSVRASWTKSLARSAAALVLASVSVGSVPGIASAATPGSQLWVKRFNGAADRSDNARALAVSPDGSTVFVTGTVEAGDFGDYETVAYHASTGTAIWMRRYQGPGDGTDAAESIAVSPDGSDVFVTGVSLGSSGFNDFATVAYDSAAGTELWVKRYSGPSNSYNVASGLALSPDGSEVFVTGESFDAAFHRDYATVAYDAATGSEVWSKLYDGTGDGDDEATALGVSPDGSQLFVTGGSVGRSGYYDYLTVAYAASTGRRSWSTRYKGISKRLDFAAALEVSPDGSAVFVTGRSRMSGSHYDYATVAYDASNGSERWVARYNGPSDGGDSAYALEVSPDGSAVFVTGRSKGSTPYHDYATVAYDASNGSERWVARYNGPGDGQDAAAALGVSPDGSEVFVTGSSDGKTSSEDYATVAYDADSGSELWVTRYNGLGNLFDQAAALGVSPDGSEVFVTGSSYGATSLEDYATVAYSVT